jgi:serine phosphatase RsbU (regulator of sigma subunit)
MMQIIIENAGAERGVLLMEDNHRWLIYTEGKVNQPVKLFDEGIPYEEAGGNSDNPLIPISIINFVLRTRDNVVLDEATEDARFGKGAYIRRMKSKSVICTPLTYKNKLLGILYLENNLIRGAFNQERLNVLNMLTSQIAISIDNAMLYENLEEKVRERTQEVSAQKEIIEKKNQDITSSITYAKRIQEAMLPQRELISNYLTDYFIYFRPRDIVSGDFYWFLEQDGKLFFAAVDCTGHGVPGAFMSMIGSQILHDIIGRREIIDPGTVLAELHKGVNFALKQDETENRDGMDLSFCVIDIAAQQLQFAGAKNGLFFIQQNQLSEISADKLPIGGKAFKEKERLFTTQTIQYTSPTYFYMTSDGYVDQFGGPQGLKFMKKKFKELLVEIHQKPFPEQENILKNTMEAWMRGHKQTDDMLVVGFKL